MPKFVDWYMDGKINIDDLITHTMPVERDQHGLRSDARRRVDSLGRRLLSVAETPGFVAMDRNEWLAQVTEEVVEPELGLICDPHHHLWDYPENRYLLDELLADTDSGHRHRLHRVHGMRLDVPRGRGRRR